MTKLLSYSSTDFPAIKPSSSKTWLWRKRQQLLNLPLQVRHYSCKCQIRIVPNKNSLRKEEYFLVKQVPELHLFLENCLFKTTSCFSRLSLPRTHADKSRKTSALNDCLHLGSPSCNPAHHPRHRSPHTTLP